MKNYNDYKGQLLMEVNDMITLLSKVLEFLDSIDNKEPALYEMIQIRFEYLQELKVKIEISEVPAIPVELTKELKDYKKSKHFNEVIYNKMLKEATK